MARTTPDQLLAEADQLFTAMGREADNLQAQEATADVAPGITQEVVAKGWKLKAMEVSRAVNAAAPGVGSASADTLRSTSLMLGEIIHAPSPQVAFERYHARRADIEAGLAKLAEAV